MATIPSMSVRYSNEPRCWRTNQARAIGWPVPPRMPVRSANWEQMTLTATPERKPNITGSLTKRT